MYEKVWHDEFHLYCPLCEALFPINASKQVNRHNTQDSCVLHCPECDNNRFGIEIRRENFYKFE